MKCRTSQQKLDEYKREIDHLLSKGWIKPSTSQYNHPIFFSNKKDDTLEFA